MIRARTVHRRFAAATGALLTLLVTAAGASCASSDDDAADTATEAAAEELRLNQLQALGTHNSYHVAPAEPLASLIEAVAPDTWRSIDYSHDSLEVQLSEQGVRQIELDVFADPDGGRYASPVLGPPEGLGRPELLAPGFKVLHLQDSDWESTCQPLIECLGQVERWSEANPAHMPVMILIEAKDGPVASPPGAVVPLPFGEALFDALDDEIRSVFSPDDLITPDDVRGSSATLEGAVLNDGWPTLDESRGKVLFTLLDADQAATYAAAHPSLEGRVMFTDTPPGRPEAAVVVRDDPVASGAEITELVRRGYLVRTRADADTSEARLGDTSRSEAALASGAQWVSTDYPEPDPALGTGYTVAIPGGTPGRCNPVIATPGCESTDVEDPARLTTG